MNEQTEVKNIISKVIAEYLHKYNLNISVSTIRPNSYIVLLQEQGKEIMDEVINVEGMPEDISKKYVYCRAHEMVGNFLVRKYSTVLWSF